jgi:hypothetical protein
VIAFAFTRPGAVSPFTGERWPQPTRDAPGAWFGHPHACRIEHLPIWVAGELWRIELDEVTGEAGTRIFADRGRLLDRVDEWDDQTAYAFASDCCQRVLSLVSVWRGDPGVRASFAGDAATMATAATANVAGYVAELAAEHVAGPAAGVEERRRQAAWLAARLGLAELV